ncbi:hypothetical protein EXE30_04040 [Acinetobacter halotolerans]|uniref:Uncharacterized protein n=1 Tax=Acinetobacter halotolerans TaxID=1752076 RepID=A0A4Q6XLH1_9GAMM|nr:hypothetical protein [Acinetobacter halotolerans]RZF55978.1 hypothetical protein EXE30_04040 [Acinetobacter halotolerans]
MLISASSANAITNCGPYKVLGIQSQANGVNLIRLQLSTGVITWKRLGSWSVPITKSHMAIAMQAYAMGDTIVLRYQQDNYDCESIDYSTNLDMIRIGK